MISRRFMGVTFPDIQPLIHLWCRRCSRLRARGWAPSARCSATRQRRPPAPSPLQLLWETTCSLPRHRRCCPLSVAAGRHEGPQNGATCCQAALQWWRQRRPPACTPPRLRRCCPASAAAGSGQTALVSVHLKSGQAQQPCAAAGCRFLAAAHLLQPATAVLDSRWVDRTYAKKNAPTAAAVCPGSQAPSPAVVQQSQFASSCDGARECTNQATIVCQSTQGACLWPVAAASADVPPNTEGCVRWLHEFDIKVSMKSELISSSTLRGSFRALHQSPLYSRFDFVVKYVYSEAWLVMASLLGRHLKSHGTP